MPAPQYVTAAKAQHQWVWITLGDEQRARVKITAVKNSGRGFSKLSFQHPTCGRVTEEFSNRHQLEVAP